MKKKFVLGIAALAIVLIGILLLVTLSPQSDRGRYCYAVLSPIEPNGNASSAILESGCFDTFADSIQAATSGRVHLDSSVRPGDVTDEMLNSTP